jgi:hypothetical protein
MKELELLIPLAIEWAEQQEEQILQTGIKLNRDALVLAKKVGVSQPEKVRVLVVSEVPSPTSCDLLQAATDLNLISTKTAGQSLGYGIFIRYDHVHDCGLLCHELVHTRQHEKLGGIRGFLRKYLYQCVRYGYERCPMEKAARRIQNSCYLWRADGNA